ncbi:dienelactone hydrolase family protein [Polaromonas sp. DSR2-3-2]|uniref:dienelactone hydrolase family protein n=1 Tax=unclassified Polaromonas TaxID=2638319 RepID=UPI003CF74BD0
MGQFTTLTAADGFTLSAYVARPEGQPRAAIVVVQEIFGVNSHIRSVADRFAAEGYLAVAPATFDRVKPGVELGYTEDDMTAGFELKTAVDALPGAGVLPDIQAAIDHAAQLGGGKVGIIGFCWGGLLTWKAACLLTGLSAAVPYYGGGITAESEIARQPQCPVMAHFGDQDHWIPMEGIEAFQKAHPQVQAYVYPAHHGFNCDQRASYNEAAASLAHERTLAFLADKLG